jgi:hypothetical protein
MIRPAQRKKQIARLDRSRIDAPSADDSIRLDRQTEYSRYFPQLDLHFP